MDPVAHGPTREIEATIISTMETPIELRAKCPIEKLEGQPAALLRRHAKSPPA
jgi:hypothetical protein